MAEKTIASAVSAFGASARAKLTNVAISGSPEDQLRGPLETLVRDLAEIDGLPVGQMQLVGETSLAHLKTRPDFAVILWNALVGFIEVKAPGKGADPRQFRDPHDADQWKKLQSLPNLIYTDGNSFSLWRDGKLFDKIVQLEGSVEKSGAKLEAPPSLLRLISDFLHWNPIPPGTPRRLAEISARLCRLLRDEVVEQMELGNPGLTALATDWRKLLFPDADDAQFADGYAQPPGLPALNDPNAFAAVIASHQNILTRFEESLEAVAKKLANERLKLQSDKDEFVQEKTTEFEKSDQEMRAKYEAKLQELSNREKALDDRDNMHARRAIRSDLKQRLQEHAKKFTLTDKTRQLRWPLHLTVWPALIVLIAAVGYFSRFIGTSPNVDYALLVKTTLLTIAALGILAWYIRWMNRWFEQHADAEFDLKQFELDVDRASWVVETAMEWRASQHGAIPSHLLESISRNLFQRRERDRDEEMHPADYLASALLGNASHARIKLGDAELDYARPALRKAAKATEPN